MARIHPYMLWLLWLQEAQPQTHWHIDSMTQMALSCLLYILSQLREYRIVFVIIFCFTGGIIKNSPSHKKETIFFFCFKWSDTPEQTAMARVILAVVGLIAIGEVLMPSVVAKVLRGRPIPGIGFESISTLTCDYRSVIVHHIKLIL